MKPRESIKHFLILLIGFLAFDISIGQTKVDTGFNYIDKYGVKIELAKGLQLRHPVDRNFLIENLHSKLLLPQVDTAKYKFEFIVAEIKPKEKNKSYGVKIISYAISAEKRAISKPIYRVYEMRLNSKNKTLYIEEFNYDFMEF